MRAIITVLILAASLAVGGCRNEPDPVSEAPGTRDPVVAGAELTPEELGELGARIEKNPTEARRLLSEKGLDEESFEQALRRVAEDPAASQRYAEAYRRAG